MKFFDVSGYTEKPSEFMRRTVASNILYAWSAWGNHPNTGDQHPNELPPEQTVRQFVRGFNYDNPIIIDLEQYPTRKENTDQEVADSVEKLLTILGWIKEERPNSLIGFFDIVPHADWFIAYDEHYNSDYFTTWQQANDRVQGLADEADFLAPCLYTYHSRNVQPQFPDLWLNYLRRNITESHRLAKGKPIYPFMWPQYHGSNTEGLAGSYLSGEDWLYQLDILAENDGTNIGADGLFFWGGANRFYLGSWWRETRNFLYL